MDLFQEVLRQVPAGSLKDLESASIGARSELRRRFGSLENLSFDEQVRYLLHESEGPKWLRAKLALAWMSFRQSR